MRWSTGLTLSVLVAVFPLPLAAQSSTSLKDAFKNDFHVGVAISAAQFTGRDAAGAALVKAQFDSISPENTLKWEVVHPKPGNYDFIGADKYVAFGSANGMFTIGHTLVWHSQTPKWVFEDEQGKPLSREALLERMRDHIHTVAGRYKSRIKGWDVVNEALNEDGTLRQSPWLKIIGEDYIEKAFEFAHEADPAAELYYNDYSLENEAKRKGAIELVKKLKAKEVPITGVGIQGHIRLDWPSLEVEDATISDLAKLGVKVMITELDVDVLPQAVGGNSADVAQHAESRAALDPYVKGLPDSVQKQLAERYAGLFSVYRKHRGELTRVTFWGVSDADSWLNGWPIRGRTSYPLLFDRERKPKAAFEAVVKTAAN